jgi:type III secretion system needle length determinant
MTTPIPSNNPLGGYKPPAPAVHVPDPSAVDQSAAEFAALLGADSPPQSPRKVDDESSSRTESGLREESGDSRADASRGETRVTRRDRRGDSDDESGGEKEESGEPPVRSLGDAILDSLSKTQSVAPAEAPLPTDGGSLENVVQQICDKILVSDPASGGREVRITLKDSILPGTEIRLLQDAGRLQVQFVTDNVDSQNRLAQHQAALQSLLSERLEGRDVVVEVAMESGAENMGDGRSRQQRDAQEEYERQENG